MTRAALPAYSPSGAAPLLRSFLSLPLGSRSSRRLEARLCEQFAAEGVHLTGSGTQALQLAIETVVQQGGTGAIALPAYNCFDLVSAAVGAGAQVRFYDVEPATLTPSESDLERVLDAGVSAVVVAPVFGYQPDWDSVRTMVHGRGVPLIEDAAQGQGSRWSGRPAGSFGDLSVLSFGRGKGWTAGGGGALLLPASRAGADAGPALDLGLIGRPEPAPFFGGARALLEATAAWAFGRPALFGLVSRLPWLELGETHYKDPGPIRALPGAAAGLALATDGPSRAEAARRHRRAVRVSRGLVEATSLQVCLPAPLGEPGYLRLPALVAGGTGRIDPASWDRLRALGIRPGYPQVLSKLDAVGPLLPDPERSFPGAERLVHELITIPTHSLAPEIDSAELDRLCLAKSP